jgi:hypothetical protein
MPNYDLPYTKRFINGEEIKFQERPEGIIMLPNNTYRCTCGEIYKNYYLRKAHFKTVKHRILIGELPTNYKSM